MKFTFSHVIHRSSKQDIRFALEEEYAIDDKILGIFGPSGTGKSTLLKGLAGLISAANYSLQIDRQDYLNAPGANNPCVYVGSDAVLFEHLTVGDNLSLVLKHSTTSQKGRIDLARAIELCGIEHLLEHSTPALSSGEKQRVAFARALLCGKSILLLDEAFSALDWSARLYFMKVLKRLRAEYSLCFVLVSHSIKELALACDDIWLLYEGKLVLQKTVDDALDDVLIGRAQKNVSAKFGHVVQVENGQDIFGVLHLVYREPDALDEQLEVWELPASGEDTAQVVIKRSHIEKNCRLANTMDSNDDKYELIAHVIDADKVSLTYEEHLASSMLNTLLVRVTGVQEMNPQSNSFANGVVITLDANGQILRSLISKRSYANMQISKGDKLYAIFKAL